MECFIRNAFHTNPHDWPVPIFMRQARPRVRHASQEPTAARAVRAVLASSAACCQAYWAIRGRGLENGAGRWWVHGMRV